MNRKEMIAAITENNPFISNQDLVCEVLIQEMLTRKLKGGDNISQGKLSSDFNLSRGPIKLALEKLEKDHFLTKNESGTFFVNQPDVHFSANVFSFKRQLDILAVNQAIYNLSRSGLESLHACLQKMNESFQNMDYVGFCRDDLEFHLAIVDMSRNFMLCDTYKKYKNIFQFISVSIAPVMDDRLFRRLYTHHQKIFSVIKNRQTEATLAAVDAHYSSLISF